MQNGRKEYTPRPISLWPLSKNAISEDNEMFLNVFNNEQTTSKYQSDMDRLGFQSLHTPVYLQGSPFVADDPQFRGVLEISGPDISWRGISILFWIRLEDYITTTNRLIMVS